MSHECFLHTKEFVEGKVYTQMRGLVMVEFQAVSGGRWLELADVFSVCMEHSVFRCNERCTEKAHKNYPVCLKVSWILQRI